MNNLLWYFLFSQFIIVLSYPFSSPLIASDIRLHIAYIVHILASLFFALGYILKTFTIRGNSRNEPREVNVTDKYFVISYALVIFGVFVTLWQVSITINPVQYIEQLFSGYFNPSIREAFLKSSAAGGLSGIVKMFHTVPLGIYLQSKGIVTFLRVDSDVKHKFRKLNRFTLIALFIKVLFSLDRLTIMGILVANVFIMVKEKRLFNVKNFILVGIVLFLGDFLSQLRLEGYGLFDFLILYSKLSIVNLQHMINSLSGYTYGFSTILGPISFILRAFSLSSIQFDSTFMWEWNPAQYIVSYAFQDYGYFFILFFLFMGYLARKVDYKAQSINSIFYVSIYYILLFTIVSFISVPIIRSVEFWLMILIAFIMSKFISYESKVYCFKK